MNEPCILPVKPGTISELDKARLDEIGIVVIEHKNPEQLRLLRPSCEVGASGMLFAAMQALDTRNGYSKDEVFRRLLGDQVAASWEAQQRQEGGA